MISTYEKNDAQFKHKCSYFYSYKQTKPCKYDFIQPKKIISLILYIQSEIMCIILTESKWHSENQFCKSYTC